MKITWGWECARYLYSSTFASAPGIAGEKKVVNCFLWNVVEISETERATIFSSVSRVREKTAKNVDAIDGCNTTHKRVFGVIRRWKLTVNAQLDRDIDFTPDQTNLFIYNYFTTKKWTVFSVHKVQNRISWVFEKKQNTSALSGVQTAALLSNSCDSQKGLSKSETISHSKIQFYKSPIAI